MRRAFRRGMEIFMNKKLLPVIMALLIGLCVAGCEKSSDKDAVTTDFMPDTVFTVGDCRVSLSEWNLYALSQISEAENMYGTGIWGYPVDGNGKTLGDALKDDIREQIEYIKIVSARAQQYGLSIGEDEQIDINLQTDDFLSRLTEEQKKQYGITRDLVRSVYEDNLLAMKVYEDLTLNIDTTTSDEEVRHMVLQYVMILKDYEDESGEFVKYAPEEIERIRTEAEEYLRAAADNPEITRLDEMNDDRYSVVELIADLATLKEKLPDNLPGIAFSLRQDEINGLYETDDAFFIFDCVERTDEETTNAARIEIIEARQKALFEEQYTSWENEAVVKLNYNVWDTIEIK